LNVGIKSRRATLPDEIFYWGFFFLNRAFRKYMREKPTNATIIFLSVINPPVLLKHARGRGAAAVR
jgi:hypothetical protein